MNAKLEIHRKFSILAWARRVHIWIDGQEVVAIGNGKTATVDVPPGQHVIATRLGMTSGRPSTLELVEGQITRLICKIKMGLSETSFVLYREDGSRLAGDAGPAGHHGPIVLICGLVGFRAQEYRLAERATTGDGKRRCMKPMAFHGQARSRASFQA